MSFEKDLEAMAENKVSRLEKVALKLSDGVAGFDHRDEGLDKSVVRELKQKEGLTRLEKLRVKVETGWSNEIIDAIGSMEEFKIYKRAKLKEASIAGKPCLISNRVSVKGTDDRYGDSLGRSNRERMQEGLAPIDWRRPLELATDKPFELHRIGQHANGPLAELTSKERQYLALHDPAKESEMDWSTFNIECERHWQRRFDEIICSR